MSSMHIPFTAFSKLTWYVPQKIVKFTEYGQAFQSTTRSGGKGEGDWPGTETEDLEIPSAISTHANPPKAAQQTH
jgi:hypothetical protein